MEDPRKTALKNGLHQLTLNQLYRVKYYPQEILLDTYNYKDGQFCPLAIGIGLDQKLGWTNDKVVAHLESMGYSVYNTRGVAGTFYTTNRRGDLFAALDEVIHEKQISLGQRRSP